ncbi:Uncharacterised protein [Mycobacteroides abscessus subsp. abscessus]|nr:Uncharacterised protein [Mycobacteroides abscessus subsp. abscessus]
MRSHPVGWGTSTRGSESLSKGTSNNGTDTELHFGLVSRLPSSPGVATAAPSTTAVHPDVSIVAAQTAANIQRGGRITSSA